MAEQHVQIFKAIGVPDDIISKIEAVTTDNLKDFKTDDILPAFSSAYENKFLNDATFLGKLTEDKIPQTITQKISTSQYERHLNELTAVAKDMGVTVDDIPEATRRSLKGYQREIINRYATMKGTSNKDVTKLQEQLAEMSTQKTDLETSIPTKITEAVTKEKGVFQNQMIRLLGALQVGQIEGAPNPEYITDALLSKIGENYLLQLSSNGLSLDIMQKDHPTLKAVGKNNEIITFKSLAQSILEADKMITKKSSEEEGKITKVIIGGKDKDGKTIVSPDIQKYMDAEAQAKIK